MEARYYQTEAAEKTMAFIAQNNPVRHPLIVCPTGAGKSFILALITLGLVDKDNRVLIVSHVEEIISQDEEAILDLIPKNLVGVYSASLGRKERKMVTVASIQSIHRKASLFSGYKYIIVDEAHTIPHKDAGMYRTLINTIVGAVVIGLTATPFRLGAGYLTEGTGALFDEIIYDIPVERLIKEGYLSKLLTNATENELDTKKIKTIGGDYSKKDMSTQFDKDSVTVKIIEELTRYKERYNSWLLFAIDIAHAEHICFLLNEAGIRTGIVHSKQSKMARRDAIQKFKTSYYQALVSVATLTTGFNHPGIDLIGLIRPTQSPVLHLQMIGRGLRISPNKNHCLVLDFAGNLLRLGPINDVHLTLKGKGGGEAPIKACPKCRTHVPASAGTCYHCGYVFPPPKSKLQKAASSLAVVLPNTAGKELTGWYPVSSVKYSSFLSFKKKSSMRVSYTLGNRKVIHEYINPFANTKTGFNNIHWWKFRTKEPLPNSIKGMVEKSGTLKLPKTINIDFSKQYPQIMDSSF